MHFKETVGIRNNAGQIITKSETVNNVVTNFEYGYDTFGSLTSVKKNGAVTDTFGYDFNGNRTSVTSGGVTRTASFDAHDRLSSFNGVRYTYDLAGDLTSKKIGTATPTTYDYDAFGNLRGVALPSGTSIQYLVDPQNRRVGKKLNGALTQGFLYQGQLQVVAELSGTGALVSRFVYAERENVPSYMVKGGVNYRIVSDHLGSVRAVVNASNGTIVQSLEYDAWGRVVSDTRPGFQPFGYAGGLYDRDTGLVRFGARDYDPETGRWTTQDPIRFEGGLNLYGYVVQDPVSLVDANGKSPSISLGVCYLFPEYCGDFIDFKKGLSDRLILQGEALRQALRRLGVMGKCEQTRALYEDELFRNIATGVAESAVSGNGTKGIIVALVDQYVQNTFMNSLGQSTMSSLIGVLSVPFLGPIGASANAKASQLLAIDASLKRSMENAMRKAEAILSKTHININGYSDVCSCQ